MTITSGWSCALLFCLSGLVSLGLLERDAEGRYHNAADADLYLDRAL